jgi:hypothetical protein
MGLFPPDLLQAGDDRRLTSIDNHVVVDNESRKVRIEGEG